MPPRRVKPARYTEGPGRTRLGMRVTACLSVLPAATPGHDGLRPSSTCRYGSCGFATADCSRCMEVSSTLSGSQILDKQARVSFSMGCVKNTPSTLIEFYVSLSELGFPNSVFAGPWGQLLGCGGTCRGQSRKALGFPYSLWDKGKRHGEGGRCGAHGGELGVALGTETGP